MMAYSTCLSCNLQISMNVRTSDVLIYIVSVAHVHPMQHAETPLDLLPALVMKDTMEMDLANHVRLHTLDISTGS